MPYLKQSINSMCSIAKKLTPVYSYEARREIGVDKGKRLKCESSSKNKRLSKYM